MGVVDAIEWTCVLCGHGIQTEWVEQWICIKFCVKLEYSSGETIHTIQKAAALGNWWLASSLWQHDCSCMTSPADFCGETSNHPGNTFPLQPRLGALQLLAFPNLKSPLKGKRFQIIDDIQENTMGQLMATGRTVWGPKVPTLMGPRHHCLIYNVSYIFFNKCLYFSYYMAGYLLDRPCILLNSMMLGLAMGPALANGICGK